MKVYDYKYDDNFDLVIENGDFVRVESTLQHQQQLLLMQKGQLREDPTVGIGITDFINEEMGIDEFRQAVAEEFEKDGMSISSMSGKSLEDITIKAEYKDEDR